MSGTRRPKRTRHARPEALVELHSRISVGKALLAALLDAEVMTRPWIELSRYHSSTPEWQRFWSDVKRALVASKMSPAKRAQTQRKLMTISRKLTAIAQEIRNGPLDVGAFESFPPEVMTLNGIRDWDQLDALQRHAAASRLLTEWPTMAEVVASFGLRAGAIAIAYRHNPLHAAYDTRDATAITFVRTLSRSFEQRLGKLLYGVVAAVASVALGRHVTKGFVVQAVKRMRKGSQTRGGSNQVN